LGSTFSTLLGKGLKGYEQFRIDPTRFSHRGFDMKFSKLALAASAASVALGSIAGQAAAADRSVAPIEGESELGGGIGLLLGFFIVALAVGLVASDDEGPVSP
jgi:hypothetical protein